MPKKYFKVSTLSNFYIAFVLDGLQRLSSLFMLQILQSMGEKRQNAALPFTISLAVANMIASLSDVLQRSKHSEFLKLIGILLTATGAALCFFTTNIFIMIVCWGLIFGSGYGLSIPYLSRHLKSENFSELSPFLTAAPSLGVAIMPFVLHILNSYYGLQGSYLIFSGIILNYLPLSVGAAYNLEFCIPNIKWRVRKRSCQYYVSKQNISNETKIASVESFINSLEPDLILKISQSEECEDEIKVDLENYDISENKMAPICRKRSDTKGNDLKEFPIDTRMLPKNRTYSEIAVEVKNYEKGRKIFEGSFSCNEAIFEVEKNSESRRQNSGTQSTNISQADNSLEIAKAVNAMDLDVEKKLSENCTDDNLKIANTSEAVVLNMEKEFSENCTDDNLKIANISQTTTLYIEKELSKMCTDDNLKITKSSDAVILNAENELSEKCTDDNLEITQKCDENQANIMEKNILNAKFEEKTVEESIQSLKKKNSDENDDNQSEHFYAKASDKVILANKLENEPLGKELPEMCTDDSLKIAKISDAVILNAEKELSETCTDDNLEITQKCNENQANIMAKNILNAKFDEKTVEENLQNLKNKISDENADNQSEHSEVSYKVNLANTLENECWTTESSEAIELTTNTKFEDDISEKCTESQRTKSITEDCQTENLQEAKETADISVALNKIDTKITERTLQCVDQNRHLNPATTNTDLEKVNVKSSTVKCINKCPLLSPNLENHDTSTRNAIQKPPPKHSEYKIKVDVPLDIKVHVIECTILSGEDYWFENSNDEYLKPRKNNYRKHSNSLMPGTYDNIDFNSRNWQKNFAKCSELRKPKLSSIYSVSENTELDTSRSPLNAIKKEQSRISYVLSKIKPVFKFLNEISTPISLFIILISVIFEYNLAVLITIFADFGSDLDSNCSDFKWILVAFGIGGFAGKFCCCKISRTIPEKSQAVGVVLFLLTGLSTAGVLFSPNLNWLAGFYCILGALEGGISYTIPKFISEYIDQGIHSKLSSLKSFLSGLTIISIPYVIGLSRDELGDYEFLLQTLSCSSVLCALLVYFLPHLTRTSNNQKINI